MSKVFDLFIIGGGINGAGLARDAAGRGLSVCLADKGEIGGATSSWSTKLIHGGLLWYIAGAPADTSIYGLHVSTAEAVFFLGPRPISES